MALGTLARVVGQGWRRRPSTHPVAAVDVAGWTYHEPQCEFVALATPGGVPDESSARDGGQMTLAFADISARRRFSGVVATEDVVVVALEQHGPQSATLTYRTAGGKLGERLITTADLKGIAEVSERRWTFDADGAAFRLASEARRMRWAHLADPFAAVDTSNIEPYPHQIDAVYKQLLPQTPLRFLVCTSTLLEGVDFPTRTVVMVYPRRSAGPLSITDLRNLEGRAGRGGQHTSGRIVVFTPDKSAAEGVLRLFQRQLPATTSQIGKAEDILRHTADAEDLGDLEPFLLAAISEAALTDGDLRKALEEVLGRSLCFVGLIGVRRDEILNAAERLAKQIRRTYPGVWPTVVYRTGLPTSTCNEIYSKLLEMDLEPFLELGRESSRHDSPRSSAKLLERLLSEVLIGLAELRYPQADMGVEPSDVIAAWLNGTTAEAVVEAKSDVKVRDVKRCFDAISQQGPWLVGAAIEILGHLRNLDYTTRTRIYSALQLDRLRSGTPSLEASRLVAEGSEREKAAKLWSEYEASRPGIAFNDWVIGSLV